MAALAFGGLIGGGLAEGQKKNLNPTPIVRPIESFDLPPRPELQVAEWIPLDLNLVIQLLDQEIESLEQKLSLASKEEKDSLQRSVEIKKIEKEEYQKMDENNDGKIDYQEYNKRAPEIYVRTYPLKHQKIEDKEQGFMTRKENWLIFSF